MLRNQILQKTYITLILVVFSLSIVALIAELLPEVKAKMVVIPTLTLIISLCLFEIKEKIFNKKIS